jgi:hypothetical protein
MGTVTETWKFKLVGCYSASIHFYQLSRYLSGAHGYVSVAI